jgi:hypothetical protein
MIPRLFLLSVLCLALIGCRDNDKALLMVEHGFADRQLAGRTYFVHDAAEKTRARELMSEIANRDAELQRTMLSAKFKRLPVEEQMQFFNQSRQENWQLIKELRVLLAGKESR